MYEAGNEVVLLVNNRPFSANGRIVQNPPRWRASYKQGHPKQTKFKSDWIKSLCFERPSAQLIP